MKKSILFFTMVAVGLLFASPALALQVHGGWSTSTEGCADCHVTHAADAAYLLKSSGGTSQTDACYACHGIGAAASPYDVKNGAITSDFDYNRETRAVWNGSGPLGANQVHPSYAGGFVNSFDFDAADDKDTDNVAVGTDYKTSRSAHNVENIVLGETGYNASAWNANTAIPGGQAAIPNDVFKCGACHDPHGTDSADTDGAGAIELNPRLLRHTLPVTGGTPNSRNNVSITVSASTYRSTEYGEDVNAWCGGCHNYFVAQNNAGHNSDQTATAGNLGYNPNDKFRHAMGVTVVDNPTGTGVGVGFVSGAKIGPTALGKGTPTSSDNKLMCLSCHRAHGTAVANDSTISNNWKKYDGATGKGAALLRLKNRDVCYNCHGGAQANKYVND